MQIEQHKCLWLDVYNGCPSSLRGVQGRITCNVFSPCAIIQLRYSTERDKQDTASVIRTVGNRTAVLVRDLEGSTTYYFSLRAYNSAGVGPQSTVVNVTTKKPRKEGLMPLRYRDHKASNTRRHTL